MTDEKTSKPASSPFGSGLGRPPASPPPAPGKSPSPFGTPPPRPGSSPFNLPSGSAPQPPQPPRPPLPSPFGKANTKVTYEIVPLHDTVVRFELAKLHDALFTVSGLKAPFGPVKTDSPSNPAEVEWAAALDGDCAMLAKIFSDLLDDKADAETALRARMDEAWASANLTGAMLIHPWREEAKESIKTRLTAIEQPVVVLRATDPLLVLNVLSRARSTVLLANMPPALERAFLERSLYSDDPRLVALAQASGTLDEMLIEPETTEEDEDDLD